MEDTVFDSPQSFGDPQDELGGIPGGIGQLYRSVDSTRQGATVTAERYPSFQTPGPMSMSPRAEYATPGRMEGPTVTAEQPDGAVVTGEGPPPRANPATPAPTERDSTGEVRPPEVNPEVPNASLPTMGSERAQEMIGPTPEESEPETDPQTTSFPGRRGMSGGEFAQQAAETTAQATERVGEVYRNRDEYLPPADASTREERRTQRRRRAERVPGTFEFQGQAGSSLAGLYEDFRTPDEGGNQEPTGGQDTPAPPPPRQSPGRSADPEFRQTSARPDPRPAPDQQGGTQSSARPNPRPNQAGAPGQFPATPEARAGQSGQQTSQTGGQTTQASPESALPPGARPQQSGQQRGDGQYRMLEDPMFTKEFNRQRMARRQQRQRQQGGYSYEEFRREFKNAGRDPSAYLRKMEMVPADASEEEIRSMVEEGKIPFFNPATGEPPEYEPINLDLSGQKNAIRELADAKIQAAKKGVATGEENVRAANARLLANAFGPGLFQALTGTQQPTNQTTNYARSARKAGRELRNAEQRAARVEATANAKADQQIASMEAEEALRFAQDKRKMKQLNAELERNRRNAVAEARQGMISRALNMSQQDAQERVQDMYSQRQQLLKQVPQTLEQANSPEAYREYRRLRQQANRPINQETEREFGGPGPASGVRYADDVLNESRQVTGNGGNNNPQNRATNSGSTNERASGQDNGTSENTGAFFDSVFNPMQ